MTQDGKRINDVVARQSAAAAAAAAGVADQYVVRQHPAGDRYIVTAKSVGASPAPSSTAHATPRSVASTPGRRPARSLALGGGRGRDAFVRSRDNERRAEQDEQYLQYYSSWKHIATSKTEKEVDEMIMSAIQRSPMRRFLAEAGNGTRAQFLAQVLDGETRPKVPKPVTLQDKRKKQLARMKQVRARAPISSRCAVSRGRCAACARECAVCVPKRCRHHPRSQIREPILNST